MVRRAAWILCLVAAGCGDNIPPVQLHVRVIGARQAMLVYREGNGPWRTPRVVSSDELSTTYDLDVLDEYEVVSACVASSGRYDVSVAYGLRTDGDAVMSCYIPLATTESPAVLVYGQMAQPGQVSMFEQQGSQTAPWRFVLHVPPGDRDLIALGQVKSGWRALIRRDQHVTGSIDEPDIDLAADGTPMTPIQLYLGNQQGDFIQTLATLFTAHGEASLPVGDHGLLQAAPSSLLVPGDDQQLNIAASAIGSAFQPETAPFPHRFLDADVTNTGPERFTLPPKIDQVAVHEARTAPDQIDVTWDAVPVPYDVASAELAGCDGSLEATATRGWMDRHGEQLVFDLGAPGLDPRWDVDLARDHEVCFDADETTGDVTSDTGYCLVRQPARLAQPQCQPSDESARQMTERVRFAARAAARAER